MEVRPLTERTGMIDLYDENGSFVGKANVGVRIMLADGFYVPELTCGERRSDPQTPYATDLSDDDDELWCENCDIELEEWFEFCPRCGARVIEEGI